MFDLGLVSVSFRSLEPKQITELCRKYGLEYIEWGSDVHAPCADSDRINEIIELQTDCGIKCSSYGTYFRIGVNESSELYSYIDAAKKLGTDILRLWCGEKNYTDMTTDEREYIIAESKKAAKIAEECGVTLCMECHNKTFTNCLDGAIELMQAVDSPNFRMYWQPNQLKSEEENLSFFYKLLQKKRTVIKKDGFVCFDDIALFCKLRHAPLTPDEVVFLTYLAGRDDGKKAIILCNHADDKALALVRDDLKSTRIFTLEKVISVVKFFGGDDLVPKRKRNKKSFVSVVKSSVSKKKAKAYFFGSITLFFLSAVTSFSPYYLFFAVALFTLSIVSKAQKN